MRLEIKVAVVKSGRHQYEIARELGVSENALSKFIRGHGTLPPERELKYVSVSGSGNTLYLVDTLLPNRPAIIVEGVLDALAITQEAGDLIAVVAAGSTTGGRLERWIGRLALASLVLVAFDADDAGEAAAWWLKTLGKQGKRWRPYWDDPSAMLQDGADLRTWIREGLDLQPKWWREVADWQEDRREWWEERALIMEVEGDVPRDEAEQLAFGAERSRMDTVIAEFQKNAVEEADASR